MPTIPLTGRTPLALLLLLLAPLAHAQADYPPNASGGPLLMEEAAYDVRFYDLALEVDPEARTIAGTLSMYADVVVPTDRVVLDLDPPLDVESVETVAGEAVDYERDGDRIWVALGRTMQPGEHLSLTIRYAGAPRVAPNPPWVGGFTWARTADGRPWVGVSVQGEGADAWWPVKDHPSDEPDSMHVAVTVPAGLLAAANGQARGVEESADGWTTYRYAVTNPINNYGVSLGIAPYEVVEATYESPYGYQMPVRFYVLPERRADAERMLPQFLDHVRFLEDTLGPYGFRRDGYNVLHTPYLGMEHQSLIAYGDEFSDNEFGFDWLHFHELAHEWMANLVTAADWRDMWVHEGFAEYLEALYAAELAERAGEDPHAAYLGYLVTKMRHRINNARPVAPYQPTDSHGVYFGENARADGDIYFKGAWILHTLRFLLGDDAFFDGLRRITYPEGVGIARRDEGCACRFVSTEDVQYAFEQASGRDLDTFFHVYLRQPALPELAVEQTDAGLRLRWVLPEGALPEGEAFEVPVEVESGGEVHRVEMAGGEGTLALAPGASYTVDPDRWLLRVEQPTGTP